MEKMKEYFKGLFYGHQTYRSWLPSPTDYPKNEILYPGSPHVLPLIVHAVRNIARNNPCGGVPDRLRSALRPLDVPEEEFFQFTEETKER